jgi:hypothetical protein
MSASSSLWASSSCFSMSMLSQANLARFEHSASAVMSCDVMLCHVMWRKRKEIRRRKERRGDSMTGRCG